MTHSPMRAIDLVQVWGVNRLTLTLGVDGRRAAGKWCSRGIPVIAVTKTQLLQQWVFGFFF